MTDRKRLLACAVAIVLAASVANAVSLTRGPYLGRPDDVSIAVVWRTDIASDSRVDYAPFGESSLMTVKRAAATTNHVIAIEGLAPGALYRYQVYSNDVPLGTEATFRAPRDRSSEEFVFGVIGDTNTRGFPEIIARQLVIADPDFVIHTGDVVYPSGSDDLYDAEFFGPMAVLVRQAAVLPTLGNHDVRTNRGQPLLSNFVLPSSGTAAGSRFYAFRQGNALFVDLDVETSSFGKGSVQYEWLLHTLSASDAVWKFVYFHEPPYSSDHSDPLIRMILSPVFESHGVDIVFSGHSHLYERTFPICDFGSPSCRGVIYVTEGGGGAGFSEFHRESFTATVIARHGYLLGSISGARLIMTSYDVDGHVVDSFALDKTSRRSRAVRRP